MAKPAIALSGPPVFYAGGDYQVGIQITAEEALKVDYIEGRVVGRQGWAVGSGKSRVSHAMVYPTLVTRFMDRGVLPAGPSQFVMRFVLPRDLPPSHSLEPAWSQLELQFRISIPWWFDHKYKWFVPLRSPPPPVVERTPLVARSTGAHAPPDKPRVELSLPSTRLIVGEGVHGSVAVFHLDDKKDREIDLKLVPNLTLLGRGLREREGSTFGWTVTMPAGSAGQAIPFHITIPRTAVPTFVAATHILRWTLTARSGSFFGGKVSMAIPIELVDASATQHAPQLAGAPRLADERVGAAFARFAGAHGWRGHRLDDRDDDDARVAIERDLEHATLRLTYAYREDGTFLVSRIDTPSLGLGLSVSPSSAIRHVFWKDIECGLPEWDRDHLVTARFPEQTAPAVAAVAPTLMRLHTLGTLTRWTDDALTFERAVPSVEDADLVACEAALVALEATIVAARLGIAPPPGLTVDLPAWRELAASLGSQLGTGDLSIEGKLGHVPVALGLLFDGDDDHRPIGVFAAAGNPDLASAAARAVKIDLLRPAAEALGSTSLTEAVVDQLTRWSPEVTNLRVAEGSAHARYMFGSATPVVVDVAVVKGMVQGLVALLAAIDPGAGPYR